MVQDKAAGTDVQTVMQRLYKELPNYVWLAVLPQLTSRICHPHGESHRMAQHILTHLTENYPQQVRGAQADRGALAIILLFRSVRFMAFDFALGRGDGRQDCLSHRRQEANTVFQIDAVAVCGKKFRNSPGTCSLGQRQATISVNSDVGEGVSKRLAQGFGGIHQMEALERCDRYYSYLNRRASRRSWTAGNDFWLASILPIISVRTIV